MFLFSLVLLKQHEMKTNINSVSISPDNQIYVVGGEDFLLYKYNYEDGKQLGRFCFVIVGTSAIAEKVL